LDVHPKTSNLTPRPYKVLAVTAATYQEAFLLTLNWLAEQKLWRERKKRPDTSENFSPDMQYISFCPRPRGLEHTFAGKKSFRFQQVAPHVIIYRIVCVTLRDEDLSTWGYRFQRPDTYRRAFEQADGTTPLLGLMVLIEDVNWFMTIASYSGGSCRYLPRPFLELAKF
jgi:hypothetical protein